MYSSRGILFGKMLAQVREQTSSDEQVIVQIYGSSDSEIEQAAAKLLKELTYLKGVDINFGCPANCAKQQGYGYYFAGDKFGVIKRLKDAHPDRWISAKIRLEDTVEENVKTLRGFNETGMDFLTVHCRHGKLANSKS